MRIAITRAVSPRIAEAELTYQKRKPIDFERAEAQHSAYEATLTALGCAVVRADPLPDAPDGVFVEDTALVLDEIAVITRPGALSRRLETASIAPLLGRYRPVELIREPGCVDGGDLLRIGRTIYAGRSSRTNDEGISQLRNLLEPHGYVVRPTRFDGCLHLKSAATFVGVLLVNPDFVDPARFECREVVEVHPAEPEGGNALRIGDTVILSSSWPKTGSRLKSAGLDVVTVDTGELEKAEAGVTCCSLIFEG